MGAPFSFCGPHSELRKLKLRVLLRRILPLHGEIHTVNSRIEIPADEVRALSLKVDVWSDRKPLYGFIIDFDRCVLQTINTFAAHRSIALPREFPVQPRIPAQHTNFVRG